MTTRRILHVVSFLDPRAGGVTEAIRSLIEFSPPGYAHEVVTVDDPEAGFLREFSFPVHALGPCGVREYSPRLMPWMKANAGRFDAVFVHGLWVYCGYAAWRVFSGRLPYAVFPHGMLDPYFRRAQPLKHVGRWFLWLAAQFWILRGAYRVIFTCATEERLAGQSFWLHRWKPLVVAFGATGPGADAVPAVLRLAFAAAHPELAGRRFVLFLGRIHPKKGCDLLVQAFIRAAATDPLLHLVIAGPDQTGWRRELSTVAAAAGVTERVHWPGMLTGDVKWGAFYAAEAFILPSHQENFGIAVAEALACGLPVLLSDKVNIAPDILRDGAGFVESDTLEGTARLLERWSASDPQVREAMAVQARATFLERYDIRSNAAEIVRVFEPMWEPLWEPSPGTATIVGGE